MNPTPSRPLLAFGAHPDDIEFGCGAVIAGEARAGRQAHFVIGSRGEASTHGTPEERAGEARAAASLLGASLEFIELGGDGRLAPAVAHVLTLAAIIRRAQPECVLAPSPVPNQHPDHGALGAMVRDAARLARYGGVAELKDLPPHAIGQLWFYAITIESEPAAPPLLFDVSPGLASWTASMKAHVSQSRTRNYVELQLTRARLRGLQAGVEHAWPLWPNDPPVFDSLKPLTRSARRF